MGSSSVSISSTSYQNTPLTLNDKNTGQAVAGNSNSVGNTTFQGAVNVLDGGAIKNAFDFSSQSVAAMADTTALLLNSISKSNVDNLNFSERASNSALNYAEQATNKTVAEGKLNNKTLLIVGGVIVLGVLAWKWGK